MAASSISNSSFFSPYGAMGTGRTGDFFPSPWFDMATAAMPDNNRNALEWCLPPGVLVEGLGGQLQEIENVQAGSRVLTRGGTYEPVRGTSSREYSGELVELVYAGFGKQLPFRMTPEHKVWRIAAPKLKPSRLRLDADKASRVPASEVEPGDYVATPVVPGAGSVDPLFDGYLLGAYLAEAHPVGSSAGLSGVVFTLGEDDEDLGYVAEIQQLLLTHLDYSVESVTPAHRPDIRLLRVYDVEFANWCVCLGGKRSTAKRLGAEVFDWPRTQILRLLAGWIDGDGWRANGNTYKAHTSSKVLAWQLIRLANVAGLCPTLCKRPPRKTKTGFGVVNDGYQLSFNQHDSRDLREFCLKGRDGHWKAPKQGKDKRCFLQDGYVFREVVSVSRSQYTGPVYNLEVENDHSFVADGVVTSNCEFIWQSHGTYRMAHERIYSYFLTDIELGALDSDKSLGDDEKETWESVLRDTLHAMEVVLAMDRDRGCYGNSFGSMVVPFIRFLRCPKCRKGMFKLEEMEKAKDAFNLSWDGGNFNFIADCPICKVGSGYRGPWKIDDQPDDLEKKLKVKIWSPHEIEIKCDMYSGDCTYYWRIPEEYKKAIRGGDMHQLARSPLQVMNAVKHNANFRFAPDALFHMKEPTLGGIRTRGWGLSRTLTNFRNVFYVQVLRRYNEAIALDYIIPFRVITPDVKPSAGGIGGGEIAEPLRMNDMGDFTAHVRRMLKIRRRNPASWNVIPYPLKYQALGGEASQLVPTDLMNQGNEELLNAIGTPMELYKGTMQLQAAPVSLRLFEATHHSLVHDNNRFLRWLVQQTAQLLSLSPVLATMKRVTHADDFNKTMALLQLMMGQTISQTTGLKGLGIDYKDEQRRIGEEARFQQELQARIQEEMEQAAFGEQIARGQMAPGQAGAAGGDPAAMGGAAPAGGDPAAAGQGAGPVTGMVMGPNTPITPEEMLATAESMAQQLLGLPETQRLSEMRTLKNKNEVLAALVQAKVKEIRNSARSAGQSLMLGQQGAAG